MRPSTPIRTPASPAHMPYPSLSVGRRCCPYVPRGPCAAGREAHGQTGVPSAPPGVTGNGRAGRRNSGCGRGSQSRPTVATGVHRVCGHVLTGSGLSGARAGGQLGHKKGRGRAGGGVAGAVGRMRRVRRALFRWPWRGHRERAATAGACNGRWRQEGPGSLCGREGGLPLGAGTRGGVCTHLVNHVLMARIELPAHQRRIPAGCANFRGAGYASLAGAACGRGVARQPKARRGTQSREHKSVCRHETVTRTGTVRSARRPRATARQEMGKGAGHYGSRVPWGGKDGEAVNAGADDGAACGVRVGRGGYFNAKCVCVGGGDAGRMGGRGGFLGVARCLGRGGVARLDFAGVVPGVQR